MGAKKKKITQKMRSLSEELEDRHNSDLFHSLFDLHNYVSENCPEMIRAVEAEMEKQFAWGPESESEIEFLLKHATERVLNTRSNGGFKKYPWVERKLLLAPEEIAHQAIINLIVHGDGYDPSLPIGQKKTYIKKAVESVFNDLMKSEKDQEMLATEFVSFDPDRDSRESDVIDVSVQAYLVEFMSKNFTDEDKNELEKVTPENFGKTLKRILKKYNFEFG